MDPSTKALFASKGEKISFTLLFNSSGDPFSVESRQQQHVQDDYMRSIINQASLLRGLMVLFSLEEPFINS